jgi:hypothetical protein
VLSMISTTCKLGFVLALLLCSSVSTRAGLQEILDAIRESEFVFTRSETLVPFIPVAWAYDQLYPNADFSDTQSVLEDATVRQNTVEAGAVLPVSIKKRDMFLLGADVGWNKLSIETGPYRDQSIVRVIPVGAWLRQVNPDNLVGAFIAPQFTKETREGDSWGTSGYAGMICRYSISDSLSLYYGGIYEDAYGDGTLYPYLGLEWHPSPSLALSLIFPWPTLTYAPGNRWIFQLGMSPGGTSWVRRDGDYESIDAVGSWNFNAHMGYRMTGNIWVVGGAGVAGFRSFESGPDDQRIRFESDPGPVFRLALEFRP